VTSTPVSGCVLESFGRHVVVATASHGKLNCKLRGRRLSVVVGDEVLVASGASSTDWTVTDRQPRRSVFTRSDNRGLPEDIAANLDHVGIVIAPQPACDPYIVDRYLAGAMFAGIGALLVVNKCDVEMSAADKATFATIERIGVPTVRVSARHGLGMDTLQAMLGGRRTLLAGQSGVGKSTLFNQLSGGAYRATRTLSSGTGEGRHTTVSSAIVVLPWGELVDSPGVRDYAPAVVPLREVQSGYSEIAAEAGLCRFQDCLHAREPDCAVQRALAEGAIDARRYDSYRRLLNLTRQLQEKRGYRPTPKL